MGKDKKIAQMLDSGNESTKVSRTDEQSKIEKKEAKKERKRKEEEKRRLKKKKLKIKKAKDA